LYEWNELWGTELGFPSSITLVTAGSRSGSFDVLVEALDDSSRGVVQGMASGTLAPGGRLDVTVQITVARASVSSPATTPGPVQGPDGGTAIDVGAVATGPNVQASSGVAFASVSCGKFGTCAIRQDTSLWCWGDNTNGQLGIGSNLASQVPVQVL
jgi:hypothetical protein